MKLGWKLCFVDLQSNNIYKIYREMNLLTVGGDDPSEPIRRIQGVMLTFAPKERRKRKEEAKKGTDDVLCTKRP
jgi:hypothetical protein